MFSEHTSALPRGILEPIDSIVIDVLDQIQTIVSANERRQSVPEEHLKGDLRRGILLERL